MTRKEYTVRIIKSEPNAARVRFRNKSVAKNKKSRFLRIFNILAGSGLGFASGIVIYLMLKHIGINPGGLESSLIIGLPSFLGIIASISIF